MIIDSHAHIFPEHLVDRAMSALADRYSTEPVARATPDGLLRHMDECGVDRAVVVAVATRPEQVRSINTWFASLVDGRLIPFGSIHPHGDDLPGDVQYLLDSGIKGIKIHPHFQDFALDDPGFHRLLEIVGDRLVMLTHGGDEVAPVNKVETTPQRLFALYERFPQVRWVLAHLGAYQLWDGVEELLVGQDLYLDASFVFGKCPDERIERIIRNHGTAKVVWGSDFPWQTECEGLEGMRRLGLADDEMDAMLCRNVQQLLGESE